jgi:ABC-2 type transport system permease protein
MSVCKAYKKVIIKNLPSLLIYFLAFFLVAIIFVSSGGTKTTAVFSATKSRVAVFSEEQSALTDGLKSYLSSNAQVVAIEDDTQKIQDALFFGQLDSVLRIPAGFTESLLGGGGVSLKETAGASSTSGVAVNLLVNKYLSLAAMYAKNVPGISQEEIVKDVARDLQASADVAITATGEQQRTAGLAEYFKFQAYPIVAIMMTGITSIMLAFNNPEVSRRNLCSPLKPSRMSRYLFLCNLLFAVIVWAVLCVIALAMYGEFRLNMSVVLLCLNALVITLVSVSLGFLAGKFIRGDVAQAAVTNVVSLGMSFLCGVFIDQSLLGGSVQKIASFMPVYWYVKASNAIRDLSVFSFESLKPALGDMLIQLGFAAVFVVIALVATKQRRQTSESASLL